MSVKRYVYKRYVYLCGNFLIGLDRKRRLGHHTSGRVALGANGRSVHQFRIQMGFVFLTKRHVEHDLHVNVINPISVEPGQTCDKCH